MKNFARNYFANWLTVSCWDLHSKHSTWIRILSHCENCPPATPRRYFWCIWGIHVPVDKIHAQRVLSTLQQRLGQYAWNSGKGLNTQCALRVRLLRVQFMQLLPLGHNKFLSWTPINEPYHEWMWNLEMKIFLCLSWSWMFYDLMVRILMLGWIHPLSLSLPFALWI